MFKRFFSFLLTVMIIGVGYVPTNIVNPAQGRMLARRAAIMDCYRQSGGAPIEIINESFKDGCYTIKAEVH